MFCMDIPCLGMVMQVVLIVVGPNKMWDSYVAPMNMDAGNVLGSIGESSNSGTVKPLFHA